MFNFLWKTKNKDDEIEEQIKLSLERIGEVLDELEKTKIPSVTDVIFDGRSTLVLWDDGVTSKSTAAEGDTFDRVAGISIAVAKRLMGKKTLLVMAENARLIK